MRVSRIGALVMSIAVLLTACGDDEGKTGGKSRLTEPPPGWVYMGSELDESDMKFHPEVIEINVGDAVKWQNRSKTMTHSATENGKPPAFDTKSIAAGSMGVRQVVFDFVKSGDVLEYHCETPGHGTMRGKVKVK